MSARSRSPTAGPAAAHRQAVAAAVISFQRGGDREASFRLLYEAYWAAVKRFFARKGLPAEDCRDLTQETFLGIYRGLEGFRHEAQLETWIYRIANTTYLKRVRSKSTAKRDGQEVAYEESAVTVEPEGSQLEGVLRDEQVAAMKEAISELPAQMRRCLTLRLYQELSYQEIAVVMRLKIDTVKAHLFQARRRLRDRLGHTTAEDAL